MTRFKWWIGTFAVAVVSAAPGCGSANPTGPSGSLTGTWSGSVTDDMSGAGSARVQLTQRGSGVNGTFATTFPDSSRNRSGVASGTEIGGILTITLTPDIPEACTSSITLSGAVAATLTVSGDRLAGSYSSLTCGGATGGVIDLRRE